MTDNKIVSNMPEAEYHAMEALSHSWLRVLLDCPARYRYERDAGPRASSDAQEFGSLVHTLVLGTDEPYIRVDAPDWRTKDAQAIRKEARESGQVALLASAFDKAQMMAESVLANPQARALLEADGGTEESIFWDREHEDGLVKMRARLDKVAMTPQGATLVDFKTTVSADPRRFGQSVTAYGYAMQNVVYLDGWETIAEYPADFQFIVVEKEAPFLTAVYTLDDAFLGWGASEYHRGLDIFVACSAEDRWPSYPGGTLAAPAWVRRAVAEETERVADETWDRGGYDLDGAWGAEG
jgi:hypothetical protein